MTTGPEHSLRVGYEKNGHTHFFGNETPVEYSLSEEGLVEAKRLRDDLRAEDEQEEIRNSFPVRKPTTNDPYYYDSIAMQRLFEESPERDWRIYVITIEPLEIAELDFD